MLKFEEFQLVENGIVPFKFQQLILISSSLATEAMYSDDKGNRFVMAQCDSIDDLRLIDSLGKVGALLNYKGSLQKQGKIYIFYTVGEFIDIGTFAQGLLNKNTRVDQRFCIEFFQSFIYIFGQIQRLGRYLKIIAPSSIGLRNVQNQNNVGFGLLLPFSCKFFNCLLKQEYEQNLKFVAPEIIRHFNSNLTEQVCQRQFRKSCLYSIGLVLLLCFGYNFTIKQRVEASKNDKQFRSIFKKIRKQIKLLHNGKFVSKTLKLLLEDCQKSREILETFVIKIHSPQFQSLKICKDINVNDYKFYSTISQSDKGSMQKSQKTINIEINSNCSPISFTPNSTLNQSYKHKTDAIENSPVNILVSYEDQTPQSINKTKMRRQIIQQQSEMQLKGQKQQTIEQEERQKEKINEGEINDGRFKSENQDQAQVYQYNANELKIGQNSSYQIDGEYKQQPMDEQFRLQEETGVDVKSTLRRRFEMQSKFIMGAILIAFFLYGAIGYLFND